MSDRPALTFNLLTPRLFPEGSHKRSSGSPDPGGKLPRKVKRKGKR